MKATDSLFGFTKDSLFVSFSESKRPKSEFKASGFPVASTILEDSVVFDLYFSKPVLFFNKNLLRNKIDTLYEKPLFIKDPVWNNNRTNLSFKFFYQKDSLMVWKKTSLSDLNEDSVSYLSDSLYLTHYNYLEKISLNKISFFADYGAFVSIEKDTLKKRSIDFSFKEKEYYGKVSGKAVSSFPGFFIELVSKDFENIIKNKSIKKDVFSFENVPPGTYFIRVIIDENNNFLWDQGNIVKNKEPEKIFFLKSPIEVRSNWEIDDVLFEF